MNLSISNLAWNNRNFDKVLKLLKKYRFNGVEILPTKIWGNWKNIDKKKLLKFRKYLNDKNIKVSSIQSLFFNTNLLLERDEDEKKIIQHFYFLIKIAKTLRCKNLVFGSPAFRKRKKNSKIQQEEKLINILKKLKFFLKKSDVVISIEPNPKKYGCNFINNLDESYKIVKKVKSKNIRIQIDTGCLSLEKENLTQIKKYLNFTNHVHISEKNLDKLNKNNLFIKQLINLLKKRKWKKWISIEMMNINLQEIENSLKFLNSETFK
jgi:sugar phosphate isomerase/epimerase